MVGSRAEHAKVAARAKVRRVAGVVLLRMVGGIGWLDRVYYPVKNGLFVCNTGNTKPVLAAIHTLVLGGGLERVLGCPRQIMRSQINSNGSCRTHCPLASDSYFYLTSGVISGTIYWKCLRSKKFW